MDDADDVQHAEPAHALSEFLPSNELRSLLAQHGLGEHIEHARRDLWDAEAYEQGLRAPLSEAELRAVLARALLALAIALRDIAWEQRHGDGPPQLLAANWRDEIVAWIDRELAGTDAQRFPGWIFPAPLRILTQRLATNQLQQRRGRLTAEFAHPFIGDILLYQARGEQIRHFIAEQVRAAPPPVVLLAHSLGGVACVDLLVEEALAVDLLITVGSQAPFFYEINALHSLSYRPSLVLPEHFPQRWLNIYNRRDFLSYIGGSVFSERAVDAEVESRDPFPQAHTAYWENPQTWDAIAPWLSS